MEEEIFAELECGPSELTTPSPAASASQPLLNRVANESGPQRSPRVAAVLELAQTLQWSIGQLRELHLGVHQAKKSSRASSRSSPGRLPASSSTPISAAETPPPRSLGQLPRVSSPSGAASLSVPIPNNGSVSAGSTMKPLGVTSLAIPKDNSAPPAGSARSSYSQGAFESNPDSKRDQSSRAKEAEVAPVRRRSSASHCNRRDSSNFDPNLDIVQFTSPMYFVEESERKLQVEIMRLGKMEGTCKVNYSTEDSSAEAGVRYREASGQIVFKPKEHTKAITLNVIANDTWAATLEFKLVLSSPENCELGQYLFASRVKIIDNDVFPSSEYLDEIEEGEEGINGISGWGLFMEYVKLNLSVPGVRFKTFLILLMDQLHNCYLLLTLYLNIYMVDTLFNTKPSEAAETQERLWISSGPQNGRLYTACLVGLLFVLPMFIKHFWDYRKVLLDLEGMSQEYVQTNLFRKYLNFSDGSRAKVPPAHMQVAITQETVELVEGYMSSLELFAIFVKLLVLGFFILKENPRALTPIIVMPLLMVCFSYYRSRGGFDIIEMVAHKTAVVLETVTEVTNNYTLIADYQQRPQMCELFAEKCAELIEAKMPVEIFKLNNDYFPRWLGPVFTGIYIAVQADAVLTGALSVGTFLATIKVFSELGEEFTEGYKKFMKIVACFVPLRKLTHLLNMETDLMFWKNQNRKRRELTKMARLEVMHAHDEPTSPTSATNMQGQSWEKPSEKAQEFRTDKIEIKVRGLCFAFPAQAPNDVVDRYVFQNVNLHCPQGDLVAVLGSHGSGKSTLMKLLGHKLFPDDGMVFIPTHLRILHVSQQPCLLGLSPWRNLTFGRPHAVPARVRSICEEMRMHQTWNLASKELKRLVKTGHISKKDMAMSEDDDGETSGEDEVEFEEEHNESDVAWQETLSSTEVSKIHLARALIMNPEVLVMHRPLMNYDVETSNLIMDIIRRNVDNRGFHVDIHTRDRRRPRTCFFTPTTPQQARKADTIWNVVVQDNSPATVEQHATQTERDSLLNEHRELFGM